MKPRAFLLLNITVKHNKSPILMQNINTIALPQKHKNERNLVGIQKLDFINWMSSEDYGWKKDSLDTDCFVVKKTLKYTVVLRLCAR